MPTSGDNHRRNKLTGKVSRAALIAAAAIGASGLVAASAQAAAVTTAGISTANYYVNGPTVAGVSNLTPESVVLNGAVDTGGSPMTTLTVPVGAGMPAPPTATVTSSGCAVVILNGDGVTTTVGPTSV